MSTSRLHELVDRYVDDTLAPDEARELNALLESDPAAARAFWEATRDHWLTRDVLLGMRGAAYARDEAEPPARGSERRRPSSRHTRPRVVRGSFRAAHVIAVGAAAAAVVIGMLVVRSWSEPARPRRDRVAATSNVVAPPASAPERSVPVDDERTPERGAPDAPSSPEAQPRPAAPAAESAHAEQPPTPQRPVVRMPTPSAPPPTTSPSTFTAYLDSTHGTVETTPAGRTAWTRATAGSPLTEGSGLRTKRSRARVVFESGTVLMVNHWTTLTVASRDGRPGLTVIGGEVYVETAKRDAGFTVATPHGLAVDLGTRFGVDVKGHGTRVVCVEGSVEASTDAGAARLAQRQEVLIARRTSPPGRVREARDLKARLAWATSTTRVSDGLVALYRFGGPKAARVADTSGRGKPLDLTSSDSTAVKREARSLAVARPTIIASASPATKIVEACKRTNELTVELWVQPFQTSHIEPGRPDRIVTLSKDSAERNFTVGVRNEAYVVRLRTTATTDNGALADAPDTLVLASPRRSVTTKLQHVVFTRGPGRAVTLYLDGTRVAQTTLAGDFSNWSRLYRLCLANEDGQARTSWDLHWLGRYYLLAVYDRALTEAEVRRNRRAGMGAEEGNR